MRRNELFAKIVERLSHVIFNSKSVEVFIMQLSFGTFSYVTKFDICFTPLFD